MKVNFNMAVGFVKRFLIKILIEKNEKHRNELSDILFNNILKTKKYAKKHIQKYMLNNLFMYLNNLFLWFIGICRQ